MFLFFVVEWRCGCGCGDSHRIHFGTHQETLELVKELTEGHNAIEIMVWRVRVPRRKDALLALLNMTAGIEGVELEGEEECLIHLKREDCEEGEAKAPAGGVLH